MFPGDADTGVKDPVVRRDRDGRWHAWICCHPLDVPDEEDRMTTAYATSGDGLEWRWHGTVLAGRPGRWDARGARLTTVLPDGGVAYDGRATKEENWFERTGLAARDGSDGIEATSEGPVLDARYLEALPLPDGSTGSSGRRAAPTGATSFAPTSSRRGRAGALRRITRS